jgi:hypothetical protein
MCARHPACPDGKVTVAASACDYLAVAWSIPIDMIGVAFAGMFRNSDQSVRTIRKPPSSHRPRRDTKKGRQAANCNLPAFFARALCHVQPKPFIFGRPIFASRISAHPLPSSDVDYARLYRLSSRAAKKPAGKIGTRVSLRVGQVRPAG